MNSHVTVDVEKAHFLVFKMQMPTTVTRHVNSSVPMYRKRPRSPHKIPLCMVIKTIVPDSGALYYCNTGNENCFSNAYVLILVDSCCVRMVAEIATCHVATSYLTVSKAMPSKPY